MGVIPFSRADNAVDFFLRSGDFLRVLDEVVDCEGNEVRCCGTANEDVDDFIENLAFCQALAGLRIFSVDQGVQHVLLLFGGVVPALSDDLGAVVTHCLDVVVELAVVEQPVEQTRTGWPAHGLTGRGLLCFDHGGFLAQDTVHALVEEAEHVGGVVQAVQVVRHADLLLVSRRPFFDQILGSLAHASEFLPDSVWADQRGHDTVRDAPAFLLFVEGSEKTVMDGRTDGDDRTGDTFPEAGLVADFFKVGSISDEDDLVAENVDFEERT